MPSNFKMGEEVKFQQRWAFRRGDSDFDSSSHDSISSLGGEPAHKNHRLALVPVDNNETGDTIRFQNNDPGISGQNVPDKAEKGKRRRSKNVNLAVSEKKRGTCKESVRKKGKASVNEHAALDGLKNYMNSLLEELKVSRKNLLSWMKEEIEKLVKEEKASESERKEGRFREEDRLQDQNNPEENAPVQYQHLFGKNLNLQVQNQNNFEEYCQMKRHRKFGDNVQMQQISNLEDNIELQPQKNSQEKVQMQRRARTRTSTGAPKCNGSPSKRFGTSKKLANSNNYARALEDETDYSQALVLVAPTEQKREEKSALSKKSNSKSGPSDLNLQAQQQKSIVLGIKAQNCNGGSPVKPGKGKRSATSDNHCQVLNYPVNYNQGIGSVTPTEKDKGERSGLFTEPSFSSDSFNQIASSMYLTLPSVLSNPHIPNHRPDTYSFSYIQPTIAQNQAGTHAKRINPILGSSSYLGYYQSMLQAEERSRNFAQMSSRDTSFLNQNSINTSSLVGKGYTVPLQAVSGGFNVPNQFDLESLPRENSNTPTPSLSMNGGAITFSSGSYSLLEPYIANNFHSHSNYRADSRLMTYQDTCRFPK